MRIIGGKYRGKKLFSPITDKVRPTSDRAREALFNILHSSLGNNWDSYKLLDVFSGTGAFALEAISRGVAEACLLDIDLQNLQKNVAMFSAEAHKIKVIRADICHLFESESQYNLIFMDAPYNKGLSEIALNQLHQKKWLTPGALCLVEVEKNEQLDIPACYQIKNERIYGLAKIIFMEYSSDSVKDE